MSARHLVIGKVAIADRMNVRRVQTTGPAMTSGVEAMGNKASADLVDDVALNHRPDSALRKAEVLVEEALARRGVVRDQVWTWIPWLVSTAIAFRCEANF